MVIGEQTYGLGSRVKLYEMEDGSGLLGLRRVVGDRLRRALERWKASSLTR